MKKAMAHIERRFGVTGAVEQKLSTPLLLSLMGHVLFCLFFIGLPHLEFMHKPSARVINVQLVSVTALEPASASAPEAKIPEPKAPEPKAALPPEPKPEPVVAAKPKPKDAVSLAPKKEIEKKRSMKNKTYKPERVVESAIKNIEKRVESSKPDPIRQALDRIQANLKEEEKSVSTRAAGAANNAGASGKGKPTSELQKIYHMEVAYHIQKNWAFSEQLAGEKGDLYNMVAMKIMRNGVIKDIWFDSRSGNEYLDDSAYKAILKSSPLPPIPEGIGGDYIELGFRFGPKGLN